MSPSTRSLSTGRSGQHYLVSRQHIDDPAAWRTEIAWPSSASTQARSLLGIPHASHPMLRFGLIAVLNAILIGALSDERCRLTTRSETFWRALQRPVDRRPMLRAPGSRVDELS